MQPLRCDPNYDTDGSSETRNRLFLYLKESNYSGIIFGQRKALIYLYFHYLVRLLRTRHFIVGCYELLYSYQVWWSWF